MTGALTMALRNAQSGLLVNQAALEAVSQNIANVNSVGYSRKIVQLEQRVVAGIGSGVQIAQVQRTVDEQLLRSLRGEISTWGQMSSKELYFSRLQDLFGQPGENNAIAHTIAEFGASMQSLATSPDKTLDQAQMVREAHNLTQTMNTLSEDLQELRVLAEQEITTAVQRINLLIGDIEGLNNQIVRNQAINNDVTDLQDQRDVKLNELAEYIDVRYFTRNDGNVVALTEAGRTMINHISGTLLHQQTFSATAMSSHSAGQINGIFMDVEAEANDMTNELRNGRLKGLIDMRDSVIPGLQAQIDELSAQLRETYNQIHNRGLGHPGFTSQTGSRNFIDSSLQTITMGANSDVRVVMFDADGNQTASVSLVELMTDDNFGGNAAYNGGAGYALGDAWTIDEMADVVQRWLRDQPQAGAGTITGSGLGLVNAEVNVNSDGNFSINLNSTSSYFAFRDEFRVTGAGSSVAGATQTDATISFDRNGDGTIDQTVTGFANFFGINDLFVTNRQDNAWESNVVEKDYIAASGSVMEFRDSTGILGTITTMPGETLDAVATRINAGNMGVTAKVVIEGSGHRLRIIHDSGNNLVVSQTSGTLLTELNMHVADTGTSAAIQVRTDVLESPGRVARGTVLWDANKGVGGEYYTSVADATVAQQMATAYAGNMSFRAAGGMERLTMSLDGYGAAIIGFNATLTSVNERELSFQVTLKESLEFKVRTISGVNLDEEMANLIVFEQAYSAAARVIKTIQDMFDALQNAV